jgi:galactan endo-1,6-beta-galactosidase
MVMAHASYWTIVNPKRKWQIWDGWGASLAWWANAFGGGRKADALADILFTRKRVKYDGKTVPGLDMNIVRYNAGGCGKGMAPSPQMPKYKAVEGFQTDAGSWDWSKDKNQRKMLQLAKARGADRFELFANSPMWWMLEDEDTTGADDGKPNPNLNPGADRQHAAYLAEIARHAKEKWHVAFASVEPFNEPMSGFWKPKGNQEGRGFDVATQRKVLIALRQELDQRGLTSTTMAASDENTYAQAVKTWQELAGLHKDIGRVNAHGYNPGAGGYLAQYPTAQHKQDKRNLDRAVGGPIWTTEYGDHDGSGMMMAANINADIRHARARGWAYWQPIDGRAGPDKEQHWGFIDAKYPKDANDKTRPKLADLDHAKLFVFAQYSRHIRPGMQIIDPGKDENTVVAYDQKRHKLVIVTASWAENGQYVGYDLSGFTQVAGNDGKVARWATTDTGNSNGERYQYHADDTKLQNGKKFWAWFPPNSVQTFEIENVTL